MRKRADERPFSDIMFQIPRDMGLLHSMRTAKQQASIFVENVKREQGILVGSPEIIAYKNGFIDKNGLITCAEAYKSSEYGEDLIKTADDQTA